MPGCGAFCLRGQFAHRGFVFLDTNISLAGLHGTNLVANPKVRQRREFSAAPAEHSLKFTHRVYHIGDLTGRRKKMLVNEAVSIRKEYAKVRMRMIPTDDVRVLETGVHLLVDQRPRLVCERHLGEFARRVIATNVVGDIGEWTVLVVMPIADKHTANLDADICLRRAGGSHPAPSVKCASGIRHESPPGICPPTETRSSGPWHQFEPSLFLNFGKWPQDFGTVACKFVTPLLRTTAAAQYVPQRHT